MTLGQRIRSARIERGLTQKQLVGDHITRNMLSKIENDNATPSVRTLKYLAEKLEYPVSYFMSDSNYSDGTSPDGLDEMRRAYREARYTDCIDLLEGAPSSATTDEGYLLHALASLAAAHEAMQAGNMADAKGFADAADYYNKEGLYYSAEIDAEMSLILAECSLVLDVSEFEENAKEYERAVKSISFASRYDMAKAEYLLRTGETELAGRLMEKLPDGGEETPRLLYLKGLMALAEGRGRDAAETLTRAEAAASGDRALSMQIYAALEKCYRDMEDFKLAYHYAAKQLDR